MRGWWLHLACMVFLALEVAGAAWMHQSKEELESAWQRGSTQERLDALHVLTNRGRPDAQRFGSDFVAALLQEEDDRLKEAAFTIDLCKFELPELQRKYLGANGPDYPHWWRAYVFHHRKVGGYPVGGGGGLTRQELAWYLEALRDQVPPMDDIIAHLRRVADHSRRRQNALGIEAPASRNRKR